jgi:hypothetical protein
MYLIAWTATSFPVISKEIDKSLNSDSVAKVLSPLHRGVKHNSHYNLIFSCTVHIEGVEDVASSAWPLA